ncbi:hypothetical protein GCM10007972_20280 [Iodidimonas muriae]|uniref:DUF2007 domain-containing protein n=1 Tax=Iodidimonas muriae TaxID=261467 RepID=A0ABQ2LGM7_9PROT|nr:DUF2007 domain-containing protein [Iodidimonas muriae]GER07602.1 hypothetical protein JCM17843_19120 [Kordiimonadales bacterium JCM 17843]GGO13771.1 hypothetical protein GCM10007972_20280 [Iodidimonas muriae]
MRTLLTTTNPVLLSYAQSLLKDAKIDCDLFDRNVSIIEGSIGAIPRRLMVMDGDYKKARDLLVEAGLEKDLGKEEA